MSEHTVSLNLGSIFFSQLHGTTSSKSLGYMHAAVIRRLQMTGRRLGDHLGPHSRVHAVTAAQQWPGAVPGPQPLGEEESEARRHHAQNLPPNVPGPRLPAQGPPPLKRAGGQARGRAASNAPCPRGWKRSQTDSLRNFPQVLPLGLVSKLCASRERCHTHCPPPLTSGPDTRREWIDDGYPVADSIHF